MASSLKNGLYKRRMDIVVYACIVLFSVGLGVRNEWWREKNHHDEIPLLWDEAHFTLMSVELHEKMNEDPAEAYRYFVEFSPNQAPLTSLMASFLYYIFPTTVQTSLYLNTLCIMITGLCVYSIGARFNRRAGLIAAMTFLCLIPLLLYMSRLRTELPLAMMASLTVLCLVKSERFKKTPWTIATGVFGGLAMLTNPIALVYLMWPVLYCLIRGLIESRVQIKRLLNFLAGFACSFLLCLVWYMPNYEEIKRFLFRYGYGEAPEGISTSHPGLLNYPRMIWGHWEGLQPAIIVAALITIAFALYFRRRGNPVKGGRIDVWLLATWVVCAYAALNTTHDQRMRFLLPLLPGACILLGYLAASIRARSGRVIAIVVIVLACLGGLYQASSMPWTVVESIDISGEHDWKMTQILEVIAEDSQGNPDRISVAFLAHHPLFNAKAFDLEAALTGHNFHVRYPEVTKYATAIASDSDYAIYKAGYQTYDPIVPPQRDVCPISGAGVVLRKIKELELPDGKALIFRRELRRDSARPPR